MIKIAELLLDAISESYENDIQARTFGTDTELYHSEIHMLQCIEEHPGLHIAGLARLLGVTRGAASQTAKRLARKEMIVKEASPDSRKNVILRLTAKGKTASASHRSAHESYHAMIAGLLAGTDEKQRQFLSDFLLHLEKALRKN